MKKMNDWFVWWKNQWLVFDWKKSKFKGPDHLQKNLFLKNHISFAMPKKISKT